MDKDKIKVIIESSLIYYLKKNNIFEDHMSIEEIRNKLESIVEDIVVEKIIKEGTQGYWSLDDFKVAIDKISYNMRFFDEKHYIVFIHELLHALTTDKAKDACGLEIDGRGYGFTEGATEYFTQQLLKGDSYRYNRNGISFKISGSYPLEQIMIKQIAILYGEDKVKEAFLKNQELQMPLEQYLELRDNFDYILKKEENIREIINQSANKKLSKKDEEKISDIEKNISDVFIESQIYFLEQCLDAEISNMNTLQEAEELKNKIKQLNGLDINIKGNERANYEKYIFKFIRRYLEIFNKDKSNDEKITFNDVEQYIYSNSQLVLESSNIFNGVFVNIVNNIQRNIAKSDVEFIAINRGEEGVIYIRECGQEVIGDRIVKKYQYLTSEEYEKYQNEGFEYTGEILRGNIDLNKLQKNKNYEKAVANKLLSEDNIKNRTMNFGGYIGHINRNFEKCIDEQVEKRLEEDIKVYSIKPEGFEDELYIVGVDNKNCKCNQYVLVNQRNIKSKSDIRHHVLSEEDIVIYGEIDLNRIANDEEYKKYVEQEFLSRDRIEKKLETFNGYMGSIIEEDGKLDKQNYNELLEQFAVYGVKGEQKKDNFYIKEVEKTDEKDQFGNDVYIYEFITADEMLELRKNRNLYNSRNRMFIKGTKEEIENASYENILKALLEAGGYVGNDNILGDEESKKTVFLMGDEEKVFGFWKHGDKTYWVSCDMSVYLNSDYETILNNKKLILGNLDVERINNDIEYREFVMTNLVTEENLIAFIEGKIKGFNIEEKEGEFFIEKIEKSNRMSRGIER